MTALFSQLLREAAADFGTIPAVEISHLHHYAWASGDYNPIHYDAQVAQSMGLDRPIVHGMFTLGLLHKAMFAAARGAPYRIHSIEGKFLGMLFHGEPMRLTGKVFRREADEAVVWVDLSSKVEGPDASVPSRGVCNLRFELRRVPTL